MTKSRPLAAFPLVHTDNLKELRTVYDHVHAGPHLELRGGVGRLQAVKNHCRLINVSAGYASYGTAMHFRLPTSDQYAQAYLLRGKAKIVTQSAEVSPDKSTSVVISANTDSYDAFTDDAYERLSFMIDASPLTEKLAAIIGRPIASRLIFRPAQDSSHPLACGLRDHFRFILRQLDSGALMSPLIAAELEQTLMAMFLYANQHNYSQFLAGDVPSSSPREVRLAEEFIEANWMRPVTLEGLSAITGVSSRSLFRSFRNGRNCSPFDFLNGVRLRRARFLLQNPDTTTTVSAVAFTCGFGDAGQFSAAYGSAFGEAPEQTLRCSKGPKPRLH